MFSGLDAALNVDLQMLKFLRACGNDLRGYGMNCVEGQCVNRQRFALARVAGA